MKAKIFIGDHKRIDAMVHQLMNRASSYTEIVSIKQFKHLHVLSDLVVIRDIPTDQVAELYPFFKLGIPIMIGKKLKRIHPQIAVTTTGEYGHLPQDLFFREHCQKIVIND